MCLTSPLEHDKILVTVKLYNSLTPKQIRLFFSLRILTGVFLKKILVTMVNRTHILNGLVIKTMSGNHPQRTYDTCYVFGRKAHTVQFFHMDERRTM